MKQFLSLVALVLLVSAPSAQAGGDAQVWDLLIVDRDVKGTNLRDAPSGKIIKVVPNHSSRPRMVSASAEADGWFTVDVVGSRGWMHGSVLGTCAMPTEDGDPVLSVAPTNDAPSVGTLPALAPVHPISLQGEWLKVHYADSAKGMGNGWLPEQALALSESDWESCAKVWSHRK